MAIPFYACSFPTGDGSQFYHLTNKTKIEILFASMVKTLIDCLNDSICLSYACSLQFLFQYMQL